MLAVMTIETYDSTPRHSAVTGGIRTHAASDSDSDIPRKLLFLSKVDYSATA